MAGGCHYLDDAHASPTAWLADLKAHLARVGFGFEWAWRRTKIETMQNGERVVDERARTIDADAVVVAGGAQTNSLLASLGVRLPLQGGRGYSFVVPLEANDTPLLPAILAQARVATTPLEPGSWRVGGTLEIVPRAARPSPARVDGIATSPAAYSPDLAASIGAGRKSTEVWSGFQPCTPDGVPYIGRLEHYPPVMVAAGHAMTGLSIVPVTAESVGVLVDGDSPSVPSDALQLLAPERFARWRCYKANEYNAWRVSIAQYHSKW